MRRSTIPAGPPATLGLVFTGLVQAVGVVSGVQATPRGITLEVDPGGWAYRPAPGDSVCVSGVCLTHCPSDSSRGLVFEAIPETLAKTTLGALEVGARVNLEHALRADSLLGGHFVQGHVDGTGVVERVQSSGEHRVTVAVPTLGVPGVAPAWAEFASYLAPKGSICVDGVSLTIAGIHDAGRAFDVALIPTTLALTTLGSLRAGDRVNLEADMIAKTVVNFLRLRG